MPLRGKRSLSIAAASAIAIAMLVAVPSIAACYWQQTGPDSWILVVDETGQCVIGGPPGSAEAEPSPSPSPTRSSSPSGGGDSGGSAEPAPTTSPTPTPTPTTSATPQEIVDANPWLKVDTPTVKAVETTTVYNVNLRTRDGAVQTIVISSEDGGVANTCELASFCSLQVPKGGKYSWLIFNPSHFVVPGTPTVASPGNIYVAGGNGTVSAEVNVEATVATGDKANRPLSIPKTPIARGWPSTLDRIVSASIPDTVSAVNMPFAIGPTAAPATFTSLPPGLSFDANTGVVSGRPTTTGQFLAKLQIDLLEVDIAFTVGVATFTLVIDRSQVPVWTSIFAPKLPNRSLRCDEARCEFEIPLADAFDIYADSNEQRFKLAVNVPLGYQRVGEPASTRPNRDYWESTSRLSVIQLPEAIGTDPGQVTITFVPDGDPGAPQQLVMTSTSGSQRSISVDDFVWEFIPSGPTEVSVRTHPALGGSPTLTSCSDSQGAPIALVNGKAIVRISQYRTLVMKCTATNFNKVMEIFLTGYDAEKLPEFKPAITVSSDGLTAVFPTLASMFPGLSIEAIKQRVPLFHIQAAFSADGTSFVDMLSIDTPITATGFKITGLPAGIYQVDISMNDTELGRTSPVRTSFTVAGDVTAFVAGGVLNGFGAAKFEAVQP